MLFPAFKYAYHAAACLKKVMGYHQPKLACLSGKEVTAGLMEGGHHVIMACRSMDRFLHISPIISALHMACNEPWQLMGRLSQ